MSYFLNEGLKYVTQACGLDHSFFYRDALPLYKQGVDFLKQALNHPQTDPNTKKILPGNFLFFFQYIE